MRRVAVLVVLLLGVCVGCVGATNLPVDAADPDIVWDGSSYVLHTTNSPYGNVPTYTSTDLVNWTFKGDALPVLPAWAAPGYTWAPSSIRRADGRWFLYFSAALRGRTTANGQPMKCTGVASATSSTGPFVVVPERNTTPLLCDQAGGGTIDASPYVQTSDGSVFLASKTDGNANYRATAIQSIRLAGSFSGFSSATHTLLVSSPTGWEGNIVEGPDLLRTGNQLHLIYSGGDYSQKTYGQGQGLCASPYGPGCARNGRLLNDSFGYGAGGGSAFSNAYGAAIFAWHSYGDGKNLNVRTLSVAPLVVSSAGVLSVPSNGTPAAAAGSRGPQAQSVSAPRPVTLTVPSGTPITVPNAHSR